MKKDGFLSLLCAYSNSIETRDRIVANRKIVYPCDNKQCNEMQVDYNAEIIIDS